MNVSKPPLTISLAIGLLATTVVGAQTVLFVDDDATGAGDGSRWEDAFTSLQEALAAAVSGDQIWVAEGLYRPDQGSGQTPGDRSATFALVAGVQLYGGFAGHETTLAGRAALFEQTILSGDLAGNDGPGSANDDENSFHVVTNAGTGDTVLIDGFTIEAGNADGPAGTAGDDDGGGLLNTDASPTVRHCIFRHNSAVGDGGGIYNREGDPVVIDSTFIDNSAGSDGGGLYNFQSDAIVTSCSFVGNTAVDEGGGMYNSGRGPTVTHCRFVGNSVVNNGGGMGNLSSSPKVTNSSFSGNSADFGGGLSFRFNSDPVLVNSVLWGNSDRNGTGEEGQIWNNGSGVVAVTFSVVQDDDPDDASIPFGGGANGNLDDDPGFVDAVGPDGQVGTEDDDLRLTKGSPAIDVGNDGALPADTVDLDGDGDTTEPTPLDLDGRPRVIGGAVDLGAHEFGPTVDLACGGFSACPAGTFVYQASVDNQSGEILTLAVRVLPGFGVPGNPLLSARFLAAGEVLELTEQFRTPGSLPTECPATVTLQATLEDALGVPMASDICSIEFVTLSD